MKKSLQSLSVGLSIESVDTPALLLDLDALEHNLDRMSELLGPFDVRLRTHAKTHKCPTIAHLQIAHGAVGVCCQTVREAETMAHAGIDDILLTNQIADPSKANRLAALARFATIQVCVDHPIQIEMLNKSAVSYGTRIAVLVEIDVGTGRCGVQSGIQALQLAQDLARAKSLTFAGLQAYNGKAQGIRDYSLRQSTTATMVRKVEDTVLQLEKEGLPCQLVTGGGTGTFLFEADSGVFNEIQTGSYIFMDADYMQNSVESGKLSDIFENSLFVYGTVISRPKSERGVIDAGLKALAIDSGFPLVADREGVHYYAADDEHGRLSVAGNAQSITVGDKLHLIPGHCDPTVNLHDYFICIRKNRVEALWPIAARGY